MAKTVRLPLGLRIHKLHSASRKRMDDGDITGRAAGVGEGFNGEVDTGVGHNGDGHGVVG